MSTPCMTCHQLPKELPRHTCYWCGLRRDTADVNAEAALKRLAEATGDIPRTRPASEWPVGMRWCGGCRSMVGLKYCGTGSKCYGCQVVSRRTAGFGLTPDQQSQLNALSEGKCMGCDRAQRIKALAVDHDHYSGDVRGMLCQECNTTVGAFFNDADRFLRLAVYLVNPPASQIGIGKSMSRQATLHEVESRLETIFNERKLG